MPADLLVTASLPKHLREPLDADVHLRSAHWYRRRLKPQFREAALVMIADAVEAASRAMPEPTREELEALRGGVEERIGGVHAVDLRPLQQRGCVDLERALRRARVRGEVRDAEPGREVNGTEGVKEKSRPKRQMTVHCQPCAPS
jgi:hypothetical protein